MDLGFKKKCALVFGSSRGLGFAIAQLLAAEGAEIILVSRNEDQLQKAVKEIQAKTQNENIHFVPFDLDNSLDVFYEKVDKITNRVDIVVNNTGGPPPTSILDFRNKKLLWTQFFNRLFLQIVDITEHFLPAMINNHWGRILTITSSGVIEPIAAIEISNSLRSAVTAWMKTLSSAVASKGVTVNAIVPGRIETERLVEIQEHQAKQNHCSQDDIRKKSTGEIPIGRFGRAEEFAAGAVFLLSEAASYITGIQLRVDGGLIKSI